MKGIESFHFTLAVREVNNLLFSFLVQTLYPSAPTWNQPKTVEIDQHETSVSCGGSDSTKSHSPELKTDNFKKKSKKGDKLLVLNQVETVPQPEFDWMKIKRAAPKTCKLIFIKVERFRQIFARNGIIV